MLLGLACRFNMNNSIVNVFVLKKREKRSNSRNTEEDGHVPYYCGKFTCDAQFEAHCTCEFVAVFPDIKPSAVHVGNIVQGARMAWAQGRDLGISDEESESRKVSV